VEPFDQLRWVLDRLLSGQSRRRAFDAQVLDDTLRLVDAVNNGFLAILTGTGITEALSDVDGLSALYADVAAIPDQDAVMRLVGLHNLIRARAEAGNLGSTEDRAPIRTTLIATMEEVRASAMKRRRELA
jgi:hypothetical protein